MKRLMVFINDPLSEIIRKGEITERYYNPGNLFQEIHIWMINRDTPDPRLLQRMVGNAELHIHNLPINRELFIKSLAWRPLLLEGWAKPAIDLAERIRPDVVRCHDNLLNAIPAYYIKKRLGIPFVISLHAYPQGKAYTDSMNWKARMLKSTTRAVERIVLLNADRVLPVYKPIVPYLQRLGVQNYEVAYNVINPKNLRTKADYGLHSPIRILSVGRQFSAKNPTNLIKAMRSLPEASLTMIGNGPYHEMLKQVAVDHEVESRVIFRTAVPNDELCTTMVDYDICAIHSEYAEISKVVLEMLLTGMPLVINRRKEAPVPELEGDFLSMVTNSEEAYGSAIRSLINDDRLRESLGRKAHIHALDNWSPAKTEANYVRIYKEIIASRRAATVSSLSSLEEVA